MDEHLTTPSGVALVVLRVGALQASEEFYRRLGLELVVERHGQGPTHLSAQVGATVVELYPRGSGPGTEGLRLGFRIAEVDAVAATLGDSVVSDGDRDGYRLVVVRDPDGHKIELTEAPRPRPTGDPNRA